MRHGGSLDWGTLGRQHALMLGGLCDTLVSFLFDVAWTRASAEAAGSEADRYEDFEGSTPLSTTNMACRNCRFEVSAQQDPLWSRRDTIRGYARREWEMEKVVGAEDEARGVTDLYPTLASSAPSSLREEAVELAALSWFELIGWKTVPGDYLAPDGPMGARASYRDAILEPELRGALARLNPEATPAMIDAAIRTIRAAPSQDALENNRVFHPLLATGVPVEVNRDGETRTIALRLLDRANPAREQPPRRQSIHCAGRARTRAARCRRLRQRASARAARTQEPIGCASHARPGAYSVAKLSRQGAGAACASIRRWSSAMASRLASDR